MKKDFFMGVISFFLCSSACLANESDVSRENIAAIFPETKEKVAAFKTKATQDFELDLAYFKTQPLDHLDYPNVVERWDYLMGAYFWKKNILQFLCFTTEDSELIKAGKVAAEYCKREMEKACIDKKSLELFLSYARQVLDHSSKECLNPFQNYMLQCCLKTVLNAAESFSSIKEQAMQLYAASCLQKVVSFEYLQGKSKSKKFVINEPFTILNWNLCFFNEGLSLYFGGVLPWQDRLKKIASFLLSQDADVLCLQEVFSSEAAQKLYFELKDTYAHFYIHIGPKPYGFDVETMGIPSGLFVASKYLLESPQFIPFNQDQTPKIRGYGFFTGSIDKKCRIITTHLQPGQDPDDERYRKEQLSAIRQAVKGLNPIPTFLCGDLNIEKNSDEYQRQIAPYFDDFYTGGDWTCCELRDYWWKAKQNRAVFEAFPHKCEHIDYFLSCALLSNSNFTAETRVLFNNFLLAPEEALSDHQAMVSTVIIKK